MWPVSYVIGARAAIAIPLLALEAQTLEDDGLVVQYDRNKDGEDPCECSSVEALKHM